VGNLLLQKGMLLAKRKSVSLKQLLIDAVPPQGLYWWAMMFWVPLQSTQPSGFNEAKWRKLQLLADLGNKMAAQALKRRGLVQA
jgi:hypothetical protein